jgi:predicted lipid carrier protein YhbT
MTDATVEFFERLSERGVEPSLRKANATVRFDLTNGKRTERWFVRLDKGVIAVSRRNARADCVVSTDSAMFGRIASGETNALTALLREEVNVEGDVNVLVLFQRLLPDPPRSRKRPRTSAPEGRKR